MLKCLESSKSKIFQALEQFHIPHAQRCDVEKFRCFFLYIQAHVCKKNANRHRSALSVYLTQFYLFDLMAFVLDRCRWLQLLWYVRKL